MAAVTGGQALVDALRAHGVDTVFGIPGTHNLGIYAALAGSGITPILTRHEQGAGYAADGYARVTGRPGVVITTTGPAILNAAAAAAQSWSDSIPVLLISPGLPLRHPGRGNGYLHEVKNQQGALDSVVAYSHRVGSVAEIPVAVAYAFAAMTTGRPRPVHLEIPLDLLDETGDAPVVPPIEVGPAVAPDPAVRSAVALLEAATRPVLVVGGGARGAAGQVRRLAERLSAPVVSSVNGKGVLDEAHPLAVGAGLHHRAARALLAEADVVLALGTEFASSDIGPEPVRFGGPLIRVDVDAAAVVTNADPAVRLVGDAAAVGEQLLTGLGPGAPGDPARARHWQAELRRQAEQYDAPWRPVTAALNRVLDDTAIVAGDSTMACYLGALSTVAVHRPAGFLYPTGQGTLGYGLPAAIGAKLAEPGSKVVALMGDGGIMFTLPELATAARLGLAIPILVVDNGGYGEIRNEMADRGDPVHSVALGSIDFAAAGVALGCHGRFLPDAGGLAEALEEAFAADRPTVLHVLEQSRAVQRD